MDQHPTERSDADLIAASKRDPDAFRLLYDRYATRLHRYFLRRSGDTEAALDLTAETFAQAWISKGRFRDLAGGSAAPWLFTIARRVLIASVERNRLRASALERLQVELPFHPAQATPNESWLDGMREEIEAALAALPPKQRRAVELRIVRELPYETVARQLDCTQTAARIRVSRSLAWLRAQLEGTPL